MIDLILAQQNDHSSAMELIQQAKDYFKAMGVDQWQQGYPDSECIAKDINSGKGFMIVEDNVAIGYLYLDFDGEVSYNVLKGAWKTAQPYAVVHRLVIDKTHKGKGVASTAFKLVEKICLQKNVHSIRADTDSDNVNMRHFLDKNGFEFCGTIRFDNSEKIAYEKIF